MTVPKVGVNLIDGVHLAVEDLTARVSDAEGETVGLADQRWSEFVSSVVHGGTAKEGIEVGQRLIGYRQVSFMLVMELARVRMVDPGEVMHDIGLWATTLDD